jgi:hypothetical protein
MKLRAGWVLALLITFAIPAAAQGVELRGDDRSPAADTARAILARGRYLRIDRDTILPATFAAPADLVIYDAEVRLEGSVAGSVAVIGGHFYLRPGARVGGRIAVIDGGVYPSAKSQHAGILESHPSTVVVLRDTAAGGARDTGLVATVIGPPLPRTFRPLALTPTYDRVNGVTVSAGAQFRFSPDPGAGRASAFLAYRQKQDDHVGGQLRVELPLGVQSLRLEGEVSRLARTNDAWIRNDITNTVTAAVLGRDYRDYYDADRASVFVTRPFGKPIISGESWLGPRVGVQYERARSLATADDLPSLLGTGLRRENPPVLDGTIVSAIAGTTLRWRGRTVQFDGYGQVEQGFGDASFTQAMAWADFYTLTFRLQSLRVFARAMLPIASDAPPQRFGILGGPGTLPTTPIAQFRGDHLVYVTSEYVIPLPKKLEVPFLGEPSIELIHQTGAAWTGGVPPFIQNVGGGVRFFLARAGVMVNPAAGDLDPAIYWTFALPRF